MTQQNRRSEDSRLARIDENILDMKPKVNTLWDAHNQRIGEARIKGMFGGLIGGALVAFVNYFIK